MACSIKHKSLAGYVIFALLTFFFMCHRCQAQFNRVQGAEELFRALNNLQKCRRATGVSEEELRTMMQTRSIPTSRNGQCMVACMGQTYGLLPGGRFDPTAAMQLVDDTMKRIGSQDQRTASVRQHVQDIITACAGRAGRDACETAAAVASCGMQESARMRALRSL